MNSIMGEANVVNYLLKESFRLNTYNTALTNFFYEGNLVSRNQTQPSINIGSAFQSYFNIEKPDGTILKRTDVNKLISLGWKYKIELEEGVRKIYEWYKNEK